MGCDLNEVWKRGSVKFIASSLPEVLAYPADVVMCRFQCSAHPVRLLDSDWPRRTLGSLSLSLCLSLCRAHAVSTRLCKAKGELYVGPGAGLKSVVS